MLNQRIENPLIDKDVNIYKKIIGYNHFVTESFIPVGMIRLHKKKTNQGKHLIGRWRGDDPNPSPFLWQAVHPMDLARPIAEQIAAFFKQLCDTPQEAL